MKIAIVRQKEYDKMLCRVYETLADSDIIEIGYQEQAPKGCLVVTCDRIATKGSAQPVFDISHGVFWAKSGKEVFDTGVRVDYYIASSPYEIELLDLKGILPHIRKVYPTGRPDLDLFREKLLDRKSDNRHIVLYAPTWNYELNGGAGQIKRNILALKRACDSLGLELQVALHPFINSESWTDWCWVVRVYARQGEKDFLEMLSEADVLVSDCSSNAEQFLLTEKPILLYNSFDWFNSFDYNDCCMTKDAVEPLQPRFKKLRSVSYQFTGTWQLPQLLKMAISEKEDDTVRIMRKQLKNELWGTVFDGKCTERVAKAIEDAYKDAQKRGEVE